MRLTSNAFGPSQTIPADYTCKGQNISPPLTISDVPTGTSSLVLIMHDPDAPHGDFLHWSLWNIPPALSAIEVGTAPAGSCQGTNDFGQIGYGGPCSPSGTHRYMFDLYALDVPIDVVEGAARVAVEAALSAHILATAQLVGLCSAT